MLGSKSIIIKAMLLLNQKKWIILTYLLALGLFCFQTKALAPDYLCAEVDKNTAYFVRHRWYKKEFPLRVYLPLPSAQMPIKDRQMPVKAVMVAMQSWSNAWPFIRFKLVRSPQEASIEVLWHDQHFRNGQGRWGDAYLPEPVKNTNGKITHHWSKINLALSAHPGSAFFTPEPVPLNFQEIRDLAIHEFGHALGLIHSDDANDVMGGGNHFLATVLDQRNISARDVATLKRLYGIPIKSKESVCKHKGP